MGQWVLCGLRVKERERELAVCFESKQKGHFRGAHQQAMQLIFHHLKIPESRGSRTVCSLLLLQPGIMIIHRCSLRNEWLYGCGVFFCHSYCLRAQRYEIWPQSMGSKGKKQDNIPTPRGEDVHVTVFVAAENKSSQRRFATADGFIVVKTKETGVTWCAKKIISPQISNHPVMTAPNAKKGKSEEEKGTWQNSN